jgi:hypothetical protein
MGSPVQPEPEYVEDVLDDETQPGEATGTAVAEAGGSQAPALPAATEGQPPAEPGQATGAEPAPPAPTEAGVAPSPTGTAVAAPDVSQYPAWSYRAGGDEYAFPGSVRGSDGAFFPNAVLDELDHYVSQGVYHERYWQQELEQRAQSVATQLLEGHPKILEAEATLAAIDRLLKSGPEKVAAWLDDLERNRPTLMAEAKAEALARQLEAAKAGETERAEERDAQVLVPQLENTLWTTIERICADPRAKGLDPNRFYSRLVATRLDQIFFEADRDYPEYGIHKGETLVNYDVIVDEAKYEVALLQQAGNAARANAGVLGKGAEVPPTVRTASTATPPEERPKPPKFKTQDEYFEWLQTPEGKAYWNLVNE